METNFEVKLNFNCEQFYNHCKNIKKEDYKDYIIRLKNNLFWLENIETGEQKICFISDNANAETLHDIQIGIHVTSQVIEFAKKIKTSKGLNGYFCIKNKIDRIGYLYYEYEDRICKYISNPFLFDCVDNEGLDIDYNLSLDQLYNNTFADIANSINKNSNVVINIDEKNIKFIINKCKGGGALIKTIPITINKAMDIIKSIEEPAIEEPAIEEPAIEEPAIEEPAIEEPAIEEPAIEEPAIEEPAIEEPAPLYKTFTLKTQSDNITPTPPRLKQAIKYNKIAIDKILKDNVNYYLSDNPLNINQINLNCKDKNIKIFTNEFSDIDLINTINRHKEQLEFIKQVEDLFKLTSYKEYYYSNKMEIAFKIDNHDISIVYYNDNTMEIIDYSNDNIFNSIYDLYDYIDINSKIYKSNNNKNPIHNDLMTLKSLLKESLNKGLTLNDAIDTLNFTLSSIDEVINKLSA